MVTTRAGSHSNRPNTSYRPLNRRPIKQKKKKYSSLLGSWSSGSVLWLKPAFDVPPVFQWWRKNAKVSFAFALFSRCFDFLLDSGPVLCCLIKAESLWGQGPQRTWAAPSSARHIITSFRNEGSDKDHHLRITGPDGTCWYQLWQFTQTETLQTLCTHIQTVYTVSLQPLKHDKSVEKHITHTHLQMYIWL